MTMSEVVQNESSNALSEVIQNEPSDALSEVIQNEPSDASSLVENVAKGPSLEVRLKAYYFSLIPKDTPEFEGTENTITVSQWLQDVEFKFDSIGMPYSFRTDAASFLLRGPALYYLAEMGNNRVNRLEFEVFKLMMKNRFKHEEDLTNWNAKVDRFEQLDGEDGRDYTLRFRREIVDGCPNKLLDSEMRAIYFRGLRGNYKPFGSPPWSYRYYRDFEELRAEVEAKDGAELGIGRLALNVDGR